MSSTTTKRPPFGPGSELVLVGDSPAMEALRTAVDRLAATEAPVLLSGETGTGKELLARLVHARSARRAGPFVAVNCAALPAGLFAGGDELPGLGALRLRGVSRVEAAQGGTLYLEEVGELPPAQQAALLRLLDDGSFEREGAAPGLADVRIVTGTHVDLARLAALGDFRDDLYFRLSALQLAVPPLRARDGDVPRLAAHFLDRFAAEYARPGLRFGEAALQALSLHAWAGNVRELRNRVMQAVILCEGNVLGPEHLGLPRPEGDAASPMRRGSTSLRERRNMAERDAITEALRESHGQVPAAAHSLGISRAQLYRLIGRLRLPHRP